MDFVVINRLLYRLRQSGNFKNGQVFEIANQHFCFLIIVTKKFQFKNVSLAFSGNFTIGKNGAQFAPVDYAEGVDFYSNFETFPTHAQLNDFITNAIGQLGQEDFTVNNLGRLANKVSLN